MMGLVAQYLFGCMITLFPSLNIFHTICGPHICHSVQFFFLLRKLTEPSEERRGKKKMVKSYSCDWQWVPSCSVNENTIKLWVMETKNS